MAWLLYAFAVLVISGAVGLHLGKFRQAYTEMSGMMVGMTMGMLNGFLLGFAVAAATASMFWGNLFGIFLGVALGIYFGRAGGLMGMLDGGMGGAMGGSMGAMLQVMLFPQYYVLWTALLLSILYIAGIGGLIVLIERSDISHAAFHRALPWLRRAIEIEIAEAGERQRQSGHARTTAYLTDYYALLGVERGADPQAISKSYLARLAHATGEKAALLERAFATLSDPQRRAAYDRSLGSAVVAQPQAAREDGSAQPRPVPTRRPRSASSQPRKKDAPVSWVGVLALMVTAVFLMAWWITGSGNTTSNAASQVREPQMGHVSAPPANADRAALDAQAVPALLGQDGVQTLDFKVVGDYMEYKPKVIKVKQGVPARFNVSVEGRDPG